MKVTVHPKLDIFKEGTLVCLITNPQEVFLVTCIAQGYDGSSENTFWGIDLTGSRTSGGNYLKDLFQLFNGTIVIEV